MPLINDAPFPSAHRIAIIGSGPRGLSVLERLAALMLTQPPVRQVMVYLIDSAPMGTGRIWRTDQPRHYVMNTVAEEVSSFSGPLDDGPLRPGAGPSLAQWWSAVDPAYPGPNSYAPRAVHGEYMQFVLSTIEASFKSNISLHRIGGRVVDLLNTTQTRVLELDNGQSLEVDKVVIATGHPTPELTGWEKELQQFASQTQGLAFIRGDSAADMPLSLIESHHHVGIVGLGLAFHDIVAALTVGRGGRFSVVNGVTSYIPSNLEPKLFAGSRSGMLIPARGRNQKGPNFQYQPMCITREKIDALQKRGDIDFSTEVLPLLLIEINIVYFATAIRIQKGAAAELQFKSCVAQLPSLSLQALADEAARFGVSELAVLDLNRLARPFQSEHFSNPADFAQALDRVLLEDLHNAREGNVDNPLKAALDTIRDTRALIRSVVDFGRLTPRTHRMDFLQEYAPTSLFLTAGPPLYRTEQIRALIAAGVLTLVGPETIYSTDIEQQKLTIESPRVKNSRHLLDVVIDGRIPSPDLLRDPSILTRNLVRRGYWNNYINQGADEEFVTGGVSVTPAPYHPVNQHGQPMQDLYVLGLPSEHTRWFMQAGSSRPGFWTDFAQDAHHVAAHAMQPAWVDVPVQLAEMA
ncbi:FAD/NAD(P)-binding protein [Pseudomonas nunensis]|uniref:FAD/NAD(P)-binding protein n=1 Tax=Pseudomonas nunensis TaxID=2961896 RepID=A0ABY5EBE3_9PSED|nr:FAD/NAD(P)-binding protein [Pseudomonas nunensis]MCL5226414.1 FAD/NAD(P)-binding protein [Pseudomonas nunensis]UTO13101.1 FAD/NAD(P)-binding protein [Pseudomonas nunensis]